jgi:hypothetical protein
MRKFQFTMSAIKLPIAAQEVQRASYCIEKGILTVLD